MNAHQKINMKAEAWAYLTWPQYCQLVNRDLLALAPYYNARLIEQSKIVAEAENFKKIYGKSRYEYENNI
jgi:hypothetical protein